VTNTGDNMTSGSDAETGDRPAPRAIAPGKATFFIIPHIHWEGAVFKTREEYLAVGLPYITRALELLKENPDYRFTIDQACYVQPFLERYPEEAASFCQFIREGRLGVVGGTDVMLDVNMPGGESFVRQVLYGKGYFREKLDADVTTSWQLDTFGHHAQMPQLLKLAGYTSFWFFRGVSDWDVPSEFFWEGLDGSRMASVWLPLGYTLMTGAPKTLPEFCVFIQEQADALAPFARGPDRVGVAAGDVYPPEEHLPRMVDEYNRQPDAPFHVRLVVPSEVEAVLVDNRDLPVMTGELNPIFQGTYSSRIEIKQRTRELERLLCTAEKVGVVLRTQGVAVNDDILWRAWEPMLFNQAHDLMSGVMTDRVHEDTIRGYDFSQRIVEEELSSRLRQVTACVDTRGAGIPLVVFNSLEWSRSDIAFAKVALSDPGVRGVALTGPDGKSVPVQIVCAEHSADGGLIHAEIAFVARDIPALGHAVYRVEAMADGGVGDTPAALQNEVALENEFCRVECDPASGAITRLRLRADGWDVLRGPGNVVAMEKDGGDLWELYRGLDGGSRIGMKEPHPAPQPGRATFSTEQAGATGTMIRGPVFSELSVEHPFGEKGSFRTRLRLYAGLRRVEIRTHILNNDSFVRYRVLFPTSLSDGQRTDEIPFGAVSRPDGIEFPAQNWVHHGNGAKGVALLNRGLPGNNVADGVMMLSLMRSATIGGYGFGGGYEPGMGSDSGLEVGKELDFDYALFPHAGDWREGGVHREGLAFNHPLIAMTAAPHAGRWPGRWGLLTLSALNVVVSALKSGADGSAVLRLYEATGQPTHGLKIEFADRIAAAEEVDLMEDPIRKLAIADRTLSIDLRAFEIKTLRIQFAAAVLSVPHCDAGEGS